MRITKKGQTVLTLIINAFYFKAYNNFNFIGICYYNNNSFFDLSTHTHTNIKSYRSDFICYSLCYLHQDELDKTISVWNSHIIRPSKNDRVPSGRPKVMYMFPELYSTNDCISPVDDADVQLCHANCTFRPTVPCDTDIYDLCNILMAESDLQLPNDAHQALNLYLHLRNVIISFL